VRFFRSFRHIFCNEPRVRRLEDAGIATRGEIAEDGAVEPELGLGDEVEEVVRQEVVVADRPAPEVWIAFALDLDGVAAGAFLDERDLHRAARAKNAYRRPSNVISPCGVNSSFWRTCNAAALSGNVIAVRRSQPAANAAPTIASDASVA
jgi:hypothetical protein